MDFFLQNIKKLMLYKPVFEVYTALLKDCMEIKSIFFTVRLNFLNKYLFKGLLTHYVTNIRKDLNEVVILSLFSIFPNSSQIWLIEYNCHFAQLGFKSMMYIARSFNGQWGFYWFYITFTLYVARYCFKLIH